MTIPVRETAFGVLCCGHRSLRINGRTVLAPPVMGATAFVMAQFMNVSYARAHWPRPFPRLLYYIGCSCRSTATRARHELKGSPRGASLLSEAISDGWYYLLVIVLLVVMLLHFKRESHAPFYATALLTSCISGRSRRPGDCAYGGADRIDWTGGAMLWYDIAHAVLWGWAR